MAQPFRPAVWLRTAVLAALCLAAPCAWPADAPPPLSDSDVTVQRVAQGFSIDVVVHAPATPAQAWAVLTDFDHMAEFIPNLTHSEVVERGDTVLKVAQKGVARWGLLSMQVESLREVHLLPLREIRGHGLSGNVRRIDSVLQLEAEPGGTRLRYHADVEPGTWFPPLLGPSRVRHETAAQFNAIVQEMLRRR